jgi:hypothetical protein
MTPKRSRERFHIPLHVVMVNVLLYTPCHFLITALRAKYLHEPLTDKWEDHVPREVAVIANRLDGGLRKTFPLFYCVAVGQRDLLCLLEHPTSLCYKMFRNSFVILITLLRSSPNNCFADIDCLLLNAPTEDQFRADSRLTQVMEFIDRYQLTSLFAMPTPSPHEGIIITTFDVYKRIAPHHSEECKARTERSPLHSSCHQNPLPVPSKDEESDDSIYDLTINSSSSSSSTNSSPNSSQRVVQFIDSPFDVDLKDYLDACYDFDEKSHSFEHAIAIGTFKQRYDALVRHNNQSACDMIKWARVIFDMVEIDRMCHFTHGIVCGRTCSFFADLMRSFRVCCTETETTVPDNALAYFLDSRLRIRFGSITHLTPVARLRNSTTPACGTGNGSETAVSLYPPSHDCGLSHYRGTPVDLFNTQVTQHVNAIARQRKKARLHEQESSPSPSPERTATSNTLSSNTLQSTPSLHANPPATPVRPRRSPRLVTSQSPALSLLAYHYPTTPPPSESKTDVPRTPIVWFSDDDDSATTLETQIPPMTPVNTPGPDSLFSYMLEDQGDETEYHPSWDQQ